MGDFDRVGELEPADPGDGFDKMVLGMIRDPQSVDWVYEFFAEPEVILMLEEGEMVLYLWRFGGGGYYQEKHRMRLGKLFESERSEADDPDTLSAYADFLEEQAGLFRMQADLLVEPEGVGIVTMAVVSGMPYEDAIARGMGMVITASGDTTTIKRELETNRKGITSLVSFGVCGGLSPLVKAGDLISAFRVVRQSDGAVFMPDHSWRLKTVQVNVLGADGEATTTEMKQNLFRHFVCSAVDMESHVVGQLAKDYGVPFTVVRAIADPYDFTLPPAAVLPLKSDGSPDYAAIIGSVFFNPSQLPALLRAYQCNKAAVAALERAKAILQTTPSSLPTKKYLSPVGHRR